MPVLSDITATIAAAQTDLLHYITARIQRVRLMTKNFTPGTLEMQFRRIEQPLLMRLDDAKEHLLYNMQARLTDTKYRLALLSQKIEGANPQSILERGYAIVYNRTTETVIRSVQNVSEGSKLRIRLADGELYAEAQV